ncbi:MAG: amino acid ABC transporter permease [Halobacteriales archaeon]
MEDAVLQAADWAFVWDNRETLLKGTVVTVALTLFSVVIGFLLGFPVGAIEAFGRGRLRSVVRAVGVVFRGTPIVVIVVVFYFGLPIPRLGSVPWVDVSMAALVSAVLAIGFRSAAYQSQVFRGAIQSVEAGQLEAGRAIGLSQFQTIRYVVVPQALRRSVPGFQNEFTIVLKDTSIVFAIGLAELLTRGWRLFTSPGNSEAMFEVIVAISAIYFVLTFTTNRALDLANAHYAVPGGE